jgi:serine/threonine protein phosphatase PrpC
MVMCPSCGEPTTAGDRFCEACGTSLLRDGFLAMPENECPACGTSRDGGPDRCSVCGSSWTETRTRWTLDCGSVGAVSDRGLRRTRNEDACAVALGHDRAALVVCDGVASTDGADIASAVATRAAIRELKRGFDDPSCWPTLVIRAAEVAQAALGDLSDGVQPFHGCTTFLAALVRPGEVVVGNVGDSRAYLLEPDGASQLVTVDDSWAREAMESGLDDGRARSSPRAHEITAWLEGGAETPQPHVAVHRTGSAGYLIACSDGLWGYASSARDLAALVGASPNSEPSAVAQDLVEFALASGGADNVTIAVARTGPPATLETDTKDRRRYHDADLQH